MSFTKSAGASARLLVLTAAIASVVPGVAHAQPTQKSMCFDTGALSPELQTKSEALLLDALDSEHLFTLATGLKPMSAGFYGTEVTTSAPAMASAQAQAIIAAHIDVDFESLDDAARVQVETARTVQARETALQEIEDVRAILATWRCGDQIQADLLHYATARGGERALHAVVFALPSVRRLMVDKAPFFSRWAFTPSTNPIEIATAVEYARDVTRFAGYGYLFGYPDDAVQFFASAATSQDVTGHFVVRDFRAIPTFQRNDGQFTYAVPKGAAESDADRDLKARAAPILAAYRARRADYIGEGKPGAAALLRDWFCPTDDHCSPADAAL